MALRRYRLDRTFYDHLLDLEKVNTMENSRSTKAGNPTRIYAAVFVALAAITAAELLLSNPSVALARRLLNTLFVIFSLGKATLVAGFFMHLRGDNRFYTFVFLLPVALFLAFALLMIIR